ncbi:ATP-binding protein [Siccirubricoccus sp. KC 17139]|uniref:ATP-binding protein n=1 Tax=Siccirubricoccus soli TaxID=2899147 RepID=A0ABT1D9T3_9PROT|nr:ATP-binding protein [Siccirubricoccus soli]MCO6418624.1 ATP-binding protein [Siccirubricoccus soli]MCP2684759.1 ATP-binding protein [Siccirubricoccus soli]
MTTEAFGRLIRPRGAAMAAELAAACAELAAHLRAAGAGPRTIARAELVLEELALNALRHGGAAEVALSAWLGPAGWMLRLEDAGLAFDPSRPLAAPPGAGEGQGGLGLALVRRTAQAVHHARLPEGRNRVEVLLPPE